MIPYFSYVDAVEALRWYEGLGFEVLTRQDGPDGSITHAELRRGDVVVMVSSYDDHYLPPVLRQRSTGHGLYLVTDDVDGAYESALQAGSRPVIVPEDTEWATRRARVLDPGGYEWTFGSYQPG